MVHRNIVTFASLVLLLTVHETAVGQAKPDRIELQLYGVLPAEVEVNDAGEASFSKDGSWFAMQVGDGEIGVFRIVPEQPKPETKPINEEEIARLVRALDDDNFGRREKASRQLRAMGRSIEFALRAALRETESAEVQFRLQAVIKELAAPESESFPVKIELVRRFTALDSTIRTVRLFWEDKKILAAGYQRAINVFDAESFARTSQLSTNGYVMHAAFSGDGRRLVAAVDEKVEITEVASGKRITTSARHTGEMYYLDISPDSRWIACCGIPDNVTIWDVEANKRFRLLQGFGDSVGHVAFSPDGRSLACASEDGTVTIWDVPSFRQRLSLRGHIDEAWTVTFSPDGRWIASAGNSGDVILWDAVTGRVLAKDVEEGGYDRYPKFTPDGEFLLFSSASGRTGLWKIRHTK